MHHFKFLPHLSNTRIKGHIASSSRYLHQEVHPRDILAINSVGFLNLLKCQNERVSLVFLMSFLTIFLILLHYQQTEKLLNVEMARDKIERNLETKLEVAKAESFSLSIALGAVRYDRIASKNDEDLSLAH